MALRSAAAASGSVLCKRVVRKIGPDFLPIEALDSLKRCVPNSNDSDRNKIAGDESSRDLQRNASQRIFARSQIQFRNEYISSSEDDGDDNEEDKTNIIIRKQPNRTWKPSLQLKRVFSYIHDSDIQPKITIHAVKSMERTGGIFKSVLQTPYYKSETQMGLLWKGRIESKWVEFWNKEVGFFSPEEEAKIAVVLPGLNLPRSRLSEKAREDKARRKTARANRRAAKANRAQSADGNQTAGMKQNSKNESSKAKQKTSKR